MLPNSENSFVVSITLSWYLKVERRDRPAAVLVRAKPAQSGRTQRIELAGVKPTQTRNEVTEHTSADRRSSKGCARTAERTRERQARMHRRPTRNEI